MRFRAPDFAALLSLLLVLAGCHSLPEQAIAEPSLASQIKAETIKDGKAHVYIYLGTIHGLVFDLGNWHAADVFINGTKVGSVDSGDCLYVELDPGVYRFSWLERTWFQPVRSSEDVDLLDADENVFLALDIEKNAGYVFGPIGEFFDPDRGMIKDTHPEGHDDITGLTVVLPDRDALARIHPLVSQNSYLPPSW